MKIINIAVFGFMKFYCALMFISVFYSLQRSSAETRFVSGHYFFHSFSFSSFLCDIFNLKMVYVICILYLVPCIFLFTKYFVIYSSLFFPSFRVFFRDFVRHSCIFCIITSLMSNLEGYLTGFKCIVQRRTETVLVEFHDCFGGKLIQGYTCHYYILYGVGLSRR